MTIRKILAQLLATALVASSPLAAAATSFSFGSISAGDVVASITVAPVAGGVSYDAGLQRLLIDSYVSQINFTNRPPISINPGDVTFSSQLSVVSLQLIGPAISVAYVNGLFSNGLVDYSIIDTVGVGGPILMLEGHYDGNLQFTASATSGVVSGGLLANLLLPSGGDADFRSAFGPGAEIDANLALGSGSLCTTIVTCTLPAASLHSFAASPTINITPIPEPGTALLLGLGLTWLASRRKLERI
jgi:hypothetical protein